MLVGGMHLKWISLVPLQKPQASLTIHYIFFFRWLFYYMRLCKFQEGIDLDGHLNYYPLFGEQFFWLRSWLLQDLDGYDHIYVYLRDLVNFYLQLADFWDPFSTNRNPITNTSRSIWMAYFIRGISF